MRHEHLRVFLEVGGDDDDGHVTGDRIEGEQQIAAHVEVEPPGRQQKLVVRLRPALDDRDVEAVLGVSAVGDRLVISAVLGLGEPVGAERDLVGGERGRSEQTKRDRQASAQEFHGSLPSRVALVDALATWAP